MKKLYNLLKRKIKNIRIFILIFSIPFFLISCTPMEIITTSTSTGAVIADSDRSIGESVDDLGIKIKITEKYVKSDKGIFLDIDTSVRMGTVLLTGIVENQEIRIEAVRLVWEIKGVREVINEIEVGNKQNLKEYTKDLWISAQVRTKTLSELGLDVLTYNFETINGKVYVLGVANSEEESKKINDIIRTVKGVKEIANYTIIKSE